jgi:chromosome segregation ATPase
MPRRVLLFDDDASLRDALSKPLADVDATVIAVATEAQVIGAAQAGRPDLVLVGEQRGRNVRLVCERLARAPALAGVPMVAIVTAGSKTADPNEAVTAFVKRSDGANGVIGAMRTLFDWGRRVSAAPASGPSDDDLDFTLVPDDELAATRLSRLSIAPIAAAPPRTKPPAADAPRPKGRASVRPPAERKGAGESKRAASSEKTERSARTTVRPPGERTSRSDPKRVSIAPPAEKPARRSVRPPGDRDPEPPAPPRARASSKDTGSGNAGALGKRVRELEELLADARRERDESDAAWSEWVTSAEQFANEMWADRESLRKGQQALQRALQAATEDARLAKQREHAERERRELLTAEVAAFRKDASRRASLAPPSQDLAAMARNAEELSALRRQLADATQKLQASEAARNEAERNGDKLRVALDAAEMQAHRTHAELIAERERIRLGVPSVGSSADREELRRLRERLGAEQKRAIAVTAELSTTKREAEQRLKAARTEAASALESLREKLGGELRAAREQLKLVSTKLEEREGERDDARARLHGVESEREALARTLAEREATLSDEASRAHEATERLASVTDEFAEWRRRADEDREDRERAWSAQLEAQEKLYAGIADALRLELEEARAAKREIEARENEARGAAERAARKLDELRAASASHLGETERIALESELQGTRRDLANVTAERDRLRSDVQHVREQLRVAEAAREELHALHAQSAADREGAAKRDEEFARQLESLRVTVEQEKRRAADAMAARDATEQQARAELERATREAQAAIAHEVAERTRVHHETAQQLAEAGRRAHEAEAALHEARTRVELLERDLEQAKQSRDEIVRSLETELQQVDGVRGRVDESNARVAALEAQIEAERAAARRELAQTRESAEAAKRRVQERDAEHEHALAIREKAIREARGERDALRHELESLRHAHESERRSLDEQIADVRNRAIESIEAARAESERAIASARETLVAAEAREQQLRDEIERARAHEAAREGEHAQLVAAGRELETRIAALDAQLEEERAKSARERDRADAVVRDAELAERTARAAMERTEDTHRAEVAALTARVRALETSAADESARHRSALAAAEERAVAIRKERDEHAAQVAKLQNDRAILQRQIETARAEFARREAALREETARALRERDQSRDARAEALAEARAELDRVKSLADGAEARVTELTNALDAAQSERERVEHALQAAEVALADERAAASERGERAAQHDEEIARARAALAALEKQLAEERKRAFDVERMATATRASLEADLAAARDDATIVAASLRAAQEQIDSLEEGVALREAVAASIREERDQLLARRTRDEESLAEARRALEDARRDLVEAQSRALELEQRVAEIQREAEARVELLRTQSNAAMRTLRSRVDGDSEKVRKRFEELSTWLSDAEKRAGDLMSEAEHQRRLKEKAERGLVASEHAVRELTSRLEVERAQVEELAEQLEFERKRFDELQSAAQRSTTRASRPDAPDLRAELERMKIERARVEKELSAQLADLSTGLMARDAAIATLRQQLARADRPSRAKDRADDVGATARNPLPSPELLDRLQTLERERDAARVDFLRRVQEIERDYTERLIAMARADGSQVMFALSERVVALQNATARHANGDGDGGTARALEEEIEALRRENEFLLAEIERNARGSEKAK